MTKVMISAFIVFAVLLAVPMSAMAARMSSINTLFLDSSGHVIGETLGYCNGATSRAGVTNQNQPVPYYVSLYQGCGDRVRVCDDEGKCTTSGGNYAREVDVNTPTPMTDSAACITYFGGDCGQVPATSWRFGTQPPAI